MPWRPAHPIASQCRCAQRLGHHHVVVDRHEVVPQAAQQRREGVGGQRDPGGGHRAAAVRALGVDAQPGAVVVEVESAGALVQPDPVGQRDAPQAPRQPGGVDHRDPVAVGRPRRGRAASARGPGPPRRTGTPPCRRTARRARGSSRISASWYSSVATLSSPVRSNEQSMSFALIVSAMPCRFVVPQPGQQRELLGPPGEAVAEAVGDGRRAEAAVPPGRRPSDAAGLEHDDVPARVGRLGEQRGPQPGEAGADDEQVAAVAAHERGQRFGAVRRVEPEGHRARRCERGGTGGTGAARVRHGSHCFRFDRPGSSGCHGRHEWTERSAARARDAATLPSGPLGSDPARPRSPRVLDRPRAP